MSESGFTGFKDLQDEEIKYLLSDSVAWLRYQTKCYNKQITT